MTNVYGRPPRPAWPALPGTVRAAVEDIACGAVVDVATQTGGFSAGMAARLTLDDGRRVFAKASDAARDPGGHYRAELRVAPALPHDAPAPRCLGTHDDGDWVALVFADVEGRHPHRPWRAGEVTRVLDALAGATTVLTPAPVDVPPTAQWSRLGGWAEAGRARRLAEVAPWAAANLPLLLDLESRWPDAVAGDSLVHGDAYSHNILLTAGDVVLVDWPHASTGAPYLDAVVLLAEASGQGVDAQVVMERHPFTRDVPPGLVDAVLAAHAGFLLNGALDAGHFAHDHGRAIAAAKRILGLAALDWLVRRLGVT